MKHFQTFISISTCAATPRVVWSAELHQQFVTAVNQLGIDKAVPKRILDLMGVQGRASQAVRVGSLNNVPSQVRTTLVPEVPSSVRGDFGLFWAVFFDFGRFWRGYAPNTYLVCRFRGWYGTLFKECTRTT